MIKIAVLALWAPDVTTTTNFYAHAIGLPLLFNHSNGSAEAETSQHPHFNLDGTIMVIQQGKPIPAQEAVLESFPLVAFSVPDLQSAIDRLREHSISVPWGIESDGSSRWVKLYDPAGNLIELVEYLK